MIAENQALRQSSSTRKYPEHLSPSSISSFLTCSLRWKFERIDQLPAKASPALKLGGAIHRSIEVKNLAEFRNESTDDAVLFAAFDEALFLVDEGESALNIDQSELEKLRAKGHLMVKEYLNSPASKRSHRKVGVEVHLEATNDYLPVRIVGIADLIEVDELGEGLIITDYKTSATQPSGDESFKHLLQLCAYTLMCEQMSDLPVKEIRLVWITKHAQPRVFEQTLTRPDDTLISRFLKVTDHVWDGIQNERYVPQPSPMVCATCSFKEHCLAWPMQGGAS